MMENSFFRIEIEMDKNGQCEYSSIVTGKNCPKYITRFLKLVSPRLILTFNQVLEETQISDYFIGLDI